ncbi:MAG: ribosomal protein [Frankiales bacterium]|nr:ribosomal protein [Frankiales bacterium]
MARLDQRAEGWHTVWLTTRFRFTFDLEDFSATSDPATIIGAARCHLKGTTVKNAIHPEYVVTEVTSSCGNSFTTRSTAKSGSMHAEVCSACHPFYTGKQKIMDVGGRVDKFEKRYGKRTRTNA